MGRSSNTRVTREETTDKATDVSLEHWGRGAELVGDKVAGLEKHVEAPEYDTEGEYDTDTDVSDSYSLASLDAKVARKETTAEVPNYLNWGRMAELSGDKVTGLGGCQVGQFTCLGQAPERDIADTDTGDNYHARDAKVARKETTDKATDVSLEHWGRAAKPSCVERHLSRSLMGGIGSR